MHTISVTTCTPDGHYLDAEDDTVLGDNRDALHRACALAAKITIDLHANDPHIAHVHLIATNDEPWAVITSTTGGNGRTDLFASLRDIDHLTT